MHAAKEALHNAFYLAVSWLKQSFMSTVMSEESLYTEKVKF